MVIFWMRKILANISISLPIVLLIFLVGMPYLANRKLSPLACRVTKWNLPVSLATKNQVLSTPQQKITPSPVLIPRLPITCCQDDLSCFDEVIYRGDNDKLPDKKALLTAIDRSLRYLPTANVAYQGYPVPGITRDRILKSLQRFRQILLNTNSAAQLHQAIEKEFVLYQSIGNDAKGSVLFTAYYEPLYQASRVPTAEYRYPVYRIPPDLDPASSSSYTSRIRRSRRFTRR